MSLLLSCRRAVSTEDSALAFRNPVRLAYPVIQGPEFIEADRRLTIGADAPSCTCSQRERTVIDLFMVLVGLARQAQDDKELGVVVGRWPYRDNAVAVGGFNFDGPPVRRDRVVASSGRTTQFHVEYGLAGCFAERSD